MPQDAPPDGSARDPAPGPWSRVAGMQAKLHRWAADAGRRFDDLFNFVHDPATLYVAFCRVEGNRGANTPGVDGMTVALVEERIGVRVFLDDLRAQLKAGTFRPLPVRERKIPKPGGSGKLRKLGIPARRCWRESACQRGDWWPSSLASGRLRSRACSRPPRRSSPKVRLVRPLLRSSRPRTEPRPPETWRSPHR
jgi:hypothetical protein